MSVNKAGDDELTKLRHDLREFLHIVGTAMRVLPKIRKDDTKFAETLELLERDRHQASEKLERLFQLVAEERQC